MKVPMRGKVLTHIPYPEGMKANGGHLEPNAAFRPQTDFMLEFIRLGGVPTRQARRALERAATRIGVSKESLEKMLTTNTEEA